MATRKSTQSPPESSAKDITRPKTAAAAPVRAEWEKAGLKVRSQLADAIEILRKAAAAESACETQAEKAVHDLGEMLGARMLPAVLAFLEAGPINNDRAAEGDARLIDAVQIMEALAGIAVGSPFESSMRAANELLMGALAALSDTAPWIGAPDAAATPVSSDQKILLNRLAVILEKCAMLADTVEGLAEDGIAAGNESERSVDWELGCIGIAIAQLGYLADLGAAAAGGIRFRGDAEAWLLQHSYRRGEEAAHG